MSKTSTTNTIKFGKIEIPVGNGKSPYMPQVAGNFIDHGDIIKTLAIGIRDNLPVLLMGESGTGKTSAIRYLAHESKRGLRRVNLNGGTTADELVGRLLINDKGTYWVDGILTEAMRAGDFLVLDEINAALPEVLFVLQSIMDDDGYLVLTEKADKEIVHKHVDFRLFATCNPPEYAGTKEMNKALLSRFAICINADFPTAAKEKEIVKEHLGDTVAESEMCLKLIELAGQTRKAKEIGTADYAINTRDILNTLRLADMVDPMEALSLAFSNKLDSADNKALKTMARLVLPQTARKARAARRTISDPSEMVIGNVYSVEMDTHQAYYAMTDDANLLTKITNDNSLEFIISNHGTDNAVKGDEFEITGTYYEDKSEDPCERAENVNYGTKSASVVNIIAGPNKGKSAVVIHHPALGSTIDVIKNINALD
jgi:cobaltochelatase CobS